MTDPPPAPEPAPPVQTADREAPAPPPPADYQPQDAYGQSGGTGSGPGQAPVRGNNPPPLYPRQGPGYESNRGYQPMPAMPSELSIRPGTYLTVRIDQPLSSDHNHPGEAFSATLVRPLVVDGVVVAQPGQMLGGRVMEAQKAGRVEGVSRLAIELIDLPLVDGSQVPIKTQFVSFAGSTSVGRDVVGVGAAMGVGAAIGAAVNGGVGAGVGAGAGLLAGLIGVLTTRGHATVIPPESVLTFRIENPMTISTARTPQAFHFVQPEDYPRADNAQQRYAAARPARPYYGGYPGPGYGPGYYPYYPYYGGPGFSLFYGPAWHGGFYGGFSHHGGWH